MCTKQMIFRDFKSFFAKKTKKHEIITIIVLERNETAFLSPDGVLRFENINGVRVPLSNLSIFFGPAVGRADGRFTIKDEDKRGRVSYLIAWSDLIGGNRKMREVEQLQTIFVCCIVIGVVLLGITLYQLQKVRGMYGEVEDSLSGTLVALLAFMFFVIAVLINLNKVSMEARIHEIEKIEATLETGNLYYNGKQISADDMTPEQIYSDFSYAITGDGVHVYAR